MGVCWYRMHWIGLDWIGLDVFQVYKADCQIKEMKEGTMSEDDFIEEAKVIIILFLVNSHINRHFVTAGNDQTATSKPSAAVWSL